MQYRDLGPLEVIGSKVPCPPGGAKPAGILALLLLTPNRAVPADTLTEALWPDEPASKAKRSLESHVWRLRRTLQPRQADPAGQQTRVLVTAENGYLLRATADQIDSHRFASMSRWAATLLQQGRPADAAAVASEAMDLWRGPLFGPLSGQPWAAARSAELDGARALLREVRWEALLRSGQVAWVLEETAGVVAEQPLSERVWELRMWALADSGQREQALSTYQQARRLLDDELGIEPGPGLRRMHTLVLRGEAPGGTTPLTPAIHRPVRGPGALPATLSSFVGRGQDVTAVTALLQQHRLVTLVGPGGVGKTRLAVEVAKSTPAGPFGVARFLDLTTIPAVRGAGGVSDLAAAMADALALADEAAPGAGPVDALIDALAVSAGLLLTDNCEHLARPLRELLTSLLSAVPPLRVLATSREPIEVPGEVVWPVQPLSRAEAARLLTDRLATQRPRARPPEPGDDTVGAICAVVANLPLGLELAAARARTFTLTEVAASLLHRPDSVLTVTGPARHRSMTATVAWSHAQLGPGEQAVFRRLSAFPAGFDLADAETVCGFGTVPQHSVDAAVSSLVHRSLVSTTSGGDATPSAGRRSWFHMLEPVRLYAQAELTGSGEPEQVQSLLARRAAARIQARPGFGDPDRADWFDDMDRAWPAVQLALPRLLQQPEQGLPAVAGLGFYLLLRRPTGQALGWLTDRVTVAARAREQGQVEPAVAELAQAALATAQAYRHAPEPAPGADLARAAALCAIPPDSGYAVTAAEQAVAFSLALWIADRYSHAAAAAVQAARRARALGRPRLALAAYSIELLTRVITDDDPRHAATRAQPLYADALSSDAPLAATTAALVLTLASRAQGCYRDSLRWSGRQIRHYLELGGLDLADSFEQHACLLVLAGRHERAARVFGAASAARARAGLRGPRFGAPSQALEHQARAQLGEHRFIDAFRAGQYAQVDHLCAEILAGS